MHYAFLDESGTVTPFETSECFLVIAVVAADLQTSRALEGHLKRLRKKVKTPLGSELKATSTLPRHRLKLLRGIAQEDIAIVAVILDKRQIRQRLADPEDWYRTAVSVAVWHCVKRWSSLRVVLDKRYTNRIQRTRLEEAIQGKLEDLPD